MPSSNEQMLDEIAMLRTAQERYELGMGAANEGLYDWNITEGTIWFSKRWSELLGFEHDELPPVIDSFVDRLHPDELERVRGELNAHLEADKPYDSERRMRTKSGIYRWYRSRGSCIRDEAGKPVRMVGTLQDITDHKENQQRYEAIFEQAAVGISRVGTNGEWLEVNQRLCEIVGYERDELLAKTFQDITHPDDLETDLNLYEKLKSGEIPTYTLRKRYFHREGQVIWINLTTAMVRNTCGENLYCISVIEDITRQVKTEQAVEREQRKARRYADQLERRNQDLDDFAYVASHDLKAPLRAIGNLAEWVHEDCEKLLPETSVRHLNQMRERVGQMERLLDDLLHYARAGRVKDEEETVDLNQLVRELTGFLNLSEQFEIQISGELPVFTTVKAPLELIFRNLISNAVKHHDRDSGKVTVCCDGSATDYLTFEVSDDGPGIEADFRERAFAMFQRTQVRRGTEGSGIGLSIIRKTLRNYGGEVRILDHEPRGSTFQFTWPKVITEEM